jgi:hypothetical protein
LLTLRAFIRPPAPLLGGTKGRSALTTLGSTLGKPRIERPALDGTPGMAGHILSKGTCSNSAGRFRARSYFEVVVGLA